MDYRHSSVHAWSCRSMARGLSHFRYMGCL